MHLALRPSITILAAACIAASVGCQTHDRRNYTTHVDKNLHTPDPWATPTPKPVEETLPPIAPVNPLPAAVAPAVAPAPAVPAATTPPVTQ